MPSIVKLKKRYPPDRDMTHWTWILRYWSADGVKEFQEAIGWFAPTRDPWKPRGCSGPRLTEKDARAIQFQRRTELLSGLVGQPEPAEEVRTSDPASEPFDQWVKDYVEETRGTVRDSTLKEYRLALQALSKATSPAFATSVDHRTVKRFIQARLVGGAERSTVWKQVGSLRRVWYDACIEPNPWTDPKLRRQLKSTPKDWHWYSPSEFSQLMAKCDEWQVRAEKAGREKRKWLAIKGMIAVAYTGGLRMGEINHLIWSDVDLDADEIVVTPKSATDTTLKWGPKDHERRVAPLALVAKDILEQLCAIADEGNPYVFLSPDRHARIMASPKVKSWPENRPLINNLMRNFASLCKAANVPLCAFHSLRKSCCTNLLEGGVVPHAVQKIMGHSSLETTIKYYSKVRRDQIAMAREVAQQYATGKQQRPIQKAQIG